MKKEELEANKASAERAVAHAAKEYQNYKDMCKRKDLYVVIDFTEPSYRKRFHIVDANTNKIIRSHHTSHGSNSSAANKAFADKFSNTLNSHMSSLGPMRTAETYIGKHGYSCRMDGLLPGVNDNVRKRAIVLHGASYVTDAYILRNGRAGQSWGCPAVDSTIHRNIIETVKGGCFLYIYYNK